MDFEKMGGILNRAESFETSLSELKIDDISPLTLLNTENSMSDLANKIDELSETLSEINSELKTEGRNMQAIAKSVNSDGYFNW